MATTTFGVDEAKRGGSRCKNTSSCPHATEADLNPPEDQGNSPFKRTRPSGGVIAKGSVRFSKNAEGVSFGGGDSMTMKSYFHAECWPDVLHRMKNAPPLNTADYVGYEELSDKGKKEVKERLKQYEREKEEGYKPKKVNTTPKKKKAKKGEESDEEGEATSSSKPSKVKRELNGPTAWSRTYQIEMQNQTKQWQIEVNDNKATQTMTVVDSKQKPIVSSVEKADFDAATQYAMELIQGKEQAAWTLHSQSGTEPGSSSSSSGVKEEASSSSSSGKRGYPFGRAERTAPSKDPISDGVDGCFDGLTFVTTGELPNYSREAFTDMVSKYGGKVTGSVSGKTSFLVEGELESSVPTKKHKDAEAKGVPILNEEQFIAMLYKTNDENAAAIGDRPKPTRVKKEKVKQENGEDDDGETSMPKPRAKKTAVKKEKVVKEEPADEDDEEKPEPKRRAAAKKKPVVEESDSDVEEDAPPALEDDDDEPKAPPKKKGRKLPASLR